MSISECSLLYEPASYNRDSAMRTWRPPRTIDTCSCSSCSHCVCARGMLRAARSPAPDQPHRSGFTTCISASAIRRRSMNQAAATLKGTRVLLRGLGVGVRIGE